MNILESIFDFITRTPRSAVQGSSPRAKSGAKLTTARQVKAKPASGQPIKGASYTAGATLFGGGLSTNANTPGQHTPVAFGTSQGWNTRGRTKGWNRAVTLAAAGGRPQRAETSYAIQGWTGNPLAAGYSGGGYSPAAFKGGVPLELQPNPLTVVRAQGQKS